MSWLTYLVLSIYKVLIYIYKYIDFEMAECFEFFDIKSRIITSFDTLPLDVDFGHLLTGSNFSDCPRGGGGDGDGNDDGTNDCDNGRGGERGSFAGGGFYERLSILGINFKPSRYGGVTLMCNQDTDGSHIRTARLLRPHRIPPVAIYWWQIYPRECLAYSSYPPCQTSNRSVRSACIDPTGK